MVMIVGMCKELYDLSEGNYIDYRDLGANVLGFGLGCIIKGIRI